MTGHHRKDHPIDEQNHHSRATSAPAQSGGNEQRGQTFSPRTIPSSPKEETSEAPGQACAVPIGRPLPDSLYERLKKEAETEPPAPSAPQGHQDQSVQP